MAVGLGLLRLAPRDFWAMTPRELAAGLRGLGATDMRGLGAADMRGLGVGALAATPPTRAEFMRLAARFPDDRTPTS